MNTVPVSINDSAIDKKSIYDTCLTYVCIGAFVLVMIASGTTYIVYTITSLCQTSYNDQKEMCSMSNAWIYLLLNMVINAIIILTSIKSQIIYKSENSKKLNICDLQQIASFGFTIWGCIELFGVNCVNSKIMFHRPNDAKKELKGQLKI